MGEPTADYQKDVKQHFVDDIMGGMPQCASCRHQNADKPNTCQAYPQGIPLEILANEVDHHEPYKGDHGIQFEAVTDEKSTEA